jgi:hypothetical protein
MKYILIALTSALFSCSFHTDISYRADEDDEYVKADGFMISCKKDGRFLIVGTYTPDSWGEQFYYDWLKGPKTERKLIITSVDLVFLETSDTLSLHKIEKQRDYFYTSPNLDKIIEGNKKIKVNIFITDLSAGKNETKEFVLTQRKESYSTGTWMH